MSLIEYASRKIRRDTAGNWSSNNPTPLQGEWCLETDTGNVKIGDGSTAWNDLLYTDNVQIGTEKKFFTYKDRTDWGYLPFAFNNAVSQTTYNLLYAEIGDVFEAQHIAAGDSASGAGMFYPTPIPGAYERVGIPDIEVTLNQLSSNIYFLKSDWSGKIRRGTKIKLIPIDGAVIPNNLDILDLYIYEYNTTGQYYFSDTEANAVTGYAIEGDGTGSGTFRITQEGIILDDAFQGHWHKQYANNNKADPGSNNTLHMLGNGTATNTVIINNEATQYPITDGTNGTPRTTNETRPKTNISFGYIKAKKI